MDHCQNSIAKIDLQEYIYPDTTDISYYVPQSVIDEALKQNKLPQIRLAGQEQGNRPLIAVLFNRDKRPNCTERDYALPRRYMDAVLLSGGYPVPVYFEKMTEQLENLRPNGILLTGGNFALPAEWCEDKAAHAADEARLQAYMEACDFAEKYGLPTLGICAGMQILAGKHGAKIKLVSCHSGFLSQLVHPMKIMSDSLLAEIAQTDNVMVNSNHSEAVSATVFGDCKVTAIAPDGVVEAVELNHPWHKFVLGIQSHPENFVAAKNEFAVKLFQSFIKACSDVS
jgi:putative glutamine amidotransferase